MSAVPARSPKAIRARVRLRCCPVWALAHIRVSAADHWAKRIGLANLIEARGNDTVAWSADSAQKSAPCPTDQERLRYVALSASIRGGVATFSSLDRIRPFGKARRRVATSSPRCDRKTSWPQAGYLLRKATLSALAYRPHCSPPAHSRCSGLESASLSACDRARAAALVAGWENHDALQLRNVRLPSRILLQTSSCRAARSTKRY